jgi:hypothetical protein
MILRKRTAVAALGCVGIFAIGYYLGGRHSADAPNGDLLRWTANVINPASNSRADSESHGELFHLTEETSDYRQQQRLYAYAERLAAADIPRALNEALHMPLTQRNAALAILLGRWSELDPEAATKYATELPKSADPQQLRDRALSVWAGKDFNAALAWSLTQEKDNSRNRCLAELACVVAEKDPMRAMEFVRSHFKSNEVNFAYGRVFTLWAERDFEAAFAAAQAIESRSRTHLLLGVLQTQVEQDPRRVLDAVSGLKQWDTSGSLIQTALETWFRRDPAAAQQWTLSQLPGNLRSAAIYQYAVSAARQDSEGSLNWIFDKLEGKEQETAVRVAVWQMAERDVDRALTKARSLADERTRQVALGAVASGLGGTDPQRGLQILAELPEGEIRTDSTRSVCAWWAQSEPAAAAQWIVENTTESEHPYTLTQIVQDWQRSNPTEALAWAESLPSSARKVQAVNQLLYDLVRDDPEAASAQFANLDPETQRGSGEGVGRGWAYNDPKASIQWATSLSDDEARAKAIKGAYSAWGFQETPAAAKWIDALPAGPDRDAAVASFAVTTNSKDPQGSVAWALTIGDELARQNALRQVITSWIERDKPAAGTWLLGDNSIPQDLRMELQRSAGVLR